MPARSPRRAWSTSRSRWTSTTAVLPEAVAWWTQVLQTIASNETQAIKIQQSSDKKLASLMDGHRCSTANTVINTWKKTVAAAYAKLDAQLASWQLPAYSGPGGAYGTP